MAELDEIIHQPLRLRIMAALTALPDAQGLDFTRLKKLTGATGRQSGRPYRDAGEGRLCRRDESLRWQEAADRGDRHRRWARRLRPPRGDAAGNHRGFGRAELS